MAIKIADFKLISGRDTTYTIENVTTPLVISDNKNSIKANIDIGDTFSDDITYVVTISIQNGDIILFGGTPAYGGSGGVTWFDNTGAMRYTSIPATDSLELYSRTADTAPPEITINYTNTDEPIIT